MVCILSIQGDLHAHPKLPPTTLETEAFFGSDRCSKYRSQTWPFKQFQRRNSRKTNQSTLRSRNAPRLHSYARRSHCGFRSEDQRPACPASLTMRKAIAVLNRNCKISDGLRVSTVDLTDCTPATIAKKLIRINYARCKMRDNTNTEVGWPAVAFVFADWSVRSCPHWSRAKCQFVSLSWFGGDSLY